MSDVLYQIKDWNEIYENAKSRAIKEKTWCPMPNKQHGLGYSRLMQNPAGEQLYGAFVAVILVASRQKLPREGILTDNGTMDGTPLRCEDLSLITKFKPKTIQKMLDLCSSKDIAWILQYHMKDSKWIPAIPVISPKKEGRKEGIEGREGGKAFAPPSVEEVSAYARSLNFNLDAEKFIAYYQQQGWKLANGRPVVDWQACVVTWKKRSKDFSPATYVETGFSKAAKEIIRDAWAKHPRVGLGTLDDVDQVFKTACDKYRDIPKENGLTVVQFARNEFNRKIKAGRIDG